MLSFVLQSLPSVPLERRDKSFDTEQLTFDDRPPFLPWPQGYDQTMTLV